MPTTCTTSTATWTATTCSSTFGPSRAGARWPTPAVYDLVLRLRRRTGIDFDPHWCRHTYATRLLRDGTPVEVVSTLLGHSSITTTVDTYGHLTVEDARAALEAAGFLTGREVRL